MTLPLREQGREGLQVGRRRGGGAPGFEGHRSLLVAAPHAREVPPAARQVDELLLADARDRLPPAPDAEGAGTAQEALDRAPVVADLLLGPAEHGDRLGRVLALQTAAY